MPVIKIILLERVVLVETLFEKLWKLVYSNALPTL